VRLGTTYGIATPYTSFLVTEDEPSANSRQRLRDGSDRDAGDFFGRLGGETLGRERKDQGSAPVDSPPRPGAPAGDATGGGFAPSTAGSKAAPAGRREVERSLASKRLAETGPAPEESRDDDQGRGQPGGEKKAVVRILGRSFRYHDGVWIDTALDLMEKDQREKAMESIEAFSEAYFKLLAAHPDLGKAASRFASFMIKLGERVIWIKAPTEEAPVPQPGPGAKKL
ncbi:MAG: hypothetical protein KDB53_20265, partial [Planctomycetes bacterium]|nr:hypothetical protein [Planctomycetota bacterium]